MSKRLTSSGKLTGDKNQQGRKFAETCPFYICICKESIKNRKSNYEEGGDQQKKQGSQSKMKNKTQCSL